MAADSVRVKAFGYNRQTTRRKIMKLLIEFHRLEIEDLTDETKIPEKEIKAAISELVAMGSVKHGEKFYRVQEGKRRRWQEPGKHYNKLYEAIEL